MGLCLCLCLLGVVGFSLTRQIDIVYLYSVQCTVQVAAGFEDHQEFSPIVRPGQDQVETLTILALIGIGVGKLGSYITVKFQLTTE